MFAQQLNSGSVCMRNQACWLQNSESLLIDRPAARFPQNQNVPRFVPAPVQLDFLIEIRKLSNPDSYTRENWCAVKYSIAMRSQQRMQRGRSASQRSSCGRSAAARLPLVCELLLTEH
jgi:hypothetical protein